jgi:hypothetical protein
MEEEKLVGFRNTLKEARALFDKESKELTEAESRVYWLKDDLAKLRRTITALAATCSESPWTDNLGITDSCMEVMSIEKRRVNTQDVVRRLEGMGFDFSSQKNPAASVHSVLNRLAINKKIEKITDDTGKVVTWQGPKFDAEVDRQYDDFGITDEDIPF